MFLIKIASLGLHHVWAFPKTNSKATLVLWSSIFDALGYTLWALLKRGIDKVDTNSFDNQPSFHSRMLARGNGHGDIVIGCTYFDAI